MMAGLPVIATDVGGVGEAIADGRTGLLVRSGDAARTHVAQTYSFDRMVAAMEGVYRAELDAHRRAATSRSKQTRAEPRERVADGVWRPASIK